MPPLSSCEGSHWLRPGERHGPETHSVNRCALSTCQDRAGAGGLGPCSLGTAFQQKQSLNGWKASGSLTSRGNGHRPEAGGLPEVSRTKDAASGQAACEQEGRRIPKGQEGQLGA